MWMAKIERLLEVVTVGSLLNAITCLVGGSQIASRSALAGGMPKLCCFFRNSVQGVYREFFVNLKSSVLLWKHAIFLESSDIIL